MGEKKTPTTRNIHDAYRKGQSNLHSSRSRPRQYRDVAVAHCWYELVQDGGPAMFGERKLDLAGSGLSSMVFSSEPCPLKKATKQTNKQIKNKQIQTSKQNKTKQPPVPYVVHTRTKLVCFKLCVTTHEIEFSTSCLYLIKSSLCVL